MKKSMRKFNLNITRGTNLFIDMDGTLIDTDYANYLAYMKAIKIHTGKTVSIKYNANKRFTNEILKTEFPDISQKDCEIIKEKKQDYYESFLKYTDINKSILNVIYICYTTNNIYLLTNFCQKELCLH